jgi:lipopolysaccharide/colanic/teichoic acid biosynthesis glycosyltransferase
MQVGYYFLSLNDAGAKSLIVVSRTDKNPSLDCSSSCKAVIDLKGDRSVSIQSPEKNRITELERVSAYGAPTHPGLAVATPIEITQSTLPISYSVLISESKPFQWFLKRLLDVFCSLFGLLALSPLLLLVALAIKLESPGPVIYKQRRVGFKGQFFDMYKFRSMRQDADAMLAQLMAQNETNNGMFKLFNDPRVTQVGRFIRKYSIDELPQLFNVLIGNMSLVGPRPPIDRELQHYKDWHYIRFSTLPGLTGLWQVSGRSRIKEFDTVVQMDTRYIKEWNMLLDIKLILKTFPVVFGGMDTA